MTRPSTLLKMLPNLPPTTQSILQTLADHGNPLLPGLPPPPVAITEGAKQLLLAVLEDFDFEFFQDVGVKVSRKGVALGTVGARLTENLNIKHPVPNVHVMPMLELGAPKDP